MPPSVKSFLRIEFESNLKIYVNSSLSFLPKGEPKFTYFTVFCELGKNRV